MKNIPDPKYKIGDYESTGSVIKILTEKINQIIDVLNKEEKTPAHWKPKEGETYYYFDSYGPVDSKEEWIDDHIYDLFNLKSGNCFRTREEAQKKYDEIMGREV